MLFDALKYIVTYASVGTPRARGRRLQFVQYVARLKGLQIEFAKKTPWRIEMAHGSDLDRCRLGRILVPVNQIQTNFKNVVAEFVPAIEPKPVLDFNFVQDWAASNRIRHLYRF